MVGSKTWCFFGSGGDWPIEDIYARHLSWELEGQRWLTLEDSVCGELPPIGMEHRWKGVAVERARRVLVAKIRDGIGPPFKAEAISCLLEGQPRILIVDDSQMRFYSHDEFFGGAGVQVMLEVHIGRRLLGFSIDVDRVSTHPARKEVPPEVVLKKWRRWESEIHSSEQGAEVHAIQLGRNPVLVLEYAKALREVGQEKSILPILDWMNEKCQFYPGNGRNHLGNAAVICGFPDLAERYFEHFREQDRLFYRKDFMHPLVKIYVQSSRMQKGRDLLVACIKGSLQYSRSASGIDRYAAELQYQAHRNLYLQLFGEAGSQEMAREGLPESSYPQ
jgi:hypothetical protein